MSGSEAAWGRSCGPHTAPCLHVPVVPLAPLAPAASRTPPPAATHPPHPPHPAPAAMPGHQSACCGCDGACRRAAARSTLLRGGWVGGLGALLLALSGHYKLPRPFFSLWWPLDQEADPHQFSSVQSSPVCFSWSFVQADATVSTLLQGLARPGCICDLSSKTAAEAELTTPAGAGRASGGAGRSLGDAAAVRRDGHGAPCRWEREATARVWGERGLALLASGSPASADA